MKYLAKETAIENVKQFFSQTQDDSISLRDAFLAWGRPMDKEAENRAWFSNKLTHLKYHNLVKPVYRLRNSRRILEKVQLTLEGKKLLGRIAIEDNTGTENRPSENGLQTHTNGSLSFEEVMKMVANLRKDHPEFEITFDVKLRELKG